MSLSPETGGLGFTIEVLFAEMATLVPPAGSSGSKN